MATLTQEQIHLLNEKSKEVRKSIIKSITAANSGHPGGSLSIADLMTLLYYVEMNVDPKDPKNKNRDRFVLSKGHAAPAWYAVLAEKGYFDKDELLGLRKVDRMLQGHPDMKHTPGVDMSTGSLGQGISAACGMALASKIDKLDYRVFSVLGDGELEEGQVWEAFMFAAQYKLNNLTAFIDLNGLQIDGNIEEVMSPLPVKEKLEAFNWNVLEVDGHNFAELHEAIAQAKANTEAPTAIIMHTVKGKGIKDMEGIAGWHGKAPSREQCDKFLKEIEEA